MRILPDPSFFFHICHLKRIAFHLCFWTAYLCQDVLLAYLWNNSSLHGLSLNDKLFLSFQLCFALLPPKIIFTYFVLYVILDRILRQGRQYYTNFYFLAIAGIISLFVIRFIEIFLVYPGLFPKTYKAPVYFSLFGFLFCLIDLGYVSGVAIAIRQVRLQLAGKEREKLLVKEKLETELKFLRNQTNPHFLFNTLNNIYGLARRRSEDTADVVMKLSKLLRFMLYESKKSTIKIGDEVRMLDDYINLEKIRHTKKLCISFEKEIDCESEEIAPLLLLPFVENAFKHGANENRFESFISIRLQLRQGSLIFEVENSKEEVADKNVTDNIGLSNVRRQLELMYHEHDLKVLNEIETFKIILKVNLRSYAKL